MKIAKVTPWLVTVPAGGRPGSVGNTYSSKWTPTRESPAGARSPALARCPGADFIAAIREAVPNFYKLETIRSKMDAHDAFITEPLDTRDGHLYVPNEPGLGLEMNVDYLRAHAVEGFGG